MESVLSVRTLTILKTPARGIPKRERQTAAFPVLIYGAHFLATCRGGKNICKTE